MRGYVEQKEQEEFFMTDAELRRNDSQRGYDSRDFATFVAQQEAQAAKEKYDDDGFLIV